MAAELLRNFLGRLAGYGRSEEYAGESYEDNMDEDAEAEDGNDNVLNADFRTRAAHSAARRGSDSKVVDFNPPRGAYRSVLVNAVPVRYSDAEEICRHLRERHTVIFNLEEVPAELAQKIVDFVSGAVCVLDAQIVKISRNIFGVAPSDANLVSLREENENRGFSAYRSGGHRS